MLAAVVPVHNEEARIKKTMETLLAVDLDLILPIINGCSDNSYNIIRQIRSQRIFPLYFEERLGIDVPRAIGAKVALDNSVSALLFLDGDMDGAISGNLKELLCTVASGDADMALTDCYPEQPVTGLSKLASSVLNVRRRLNREIGLEKIIGVASPSHGPHVVSEQFLHTIPLVELAIPPVSLSLAAKHKLKIVVGSKTPHIALGSPGKNTIHSELIAQTIIGDCLEAICVYRDKKRDRLAGSVRYDGYNSTRRWDLLEEVLGGNRLKLY